MAKPKINLSKESISHFFLLHTEKIILGLAILALGYLFYNGWSTKQYTNTEPAKLKKLAEDAKQHIANQNAWTNISKFREADDDAHERIVEASKRPIDVTSYSIGRMMGTPVVSLGLRSDPRLFPVEDLTARVFTKSILFNYSQESKLDDLKRAAGFDAGVGLDPVELPRENRRGEEVIKLPEFGTEVPLVMQREMVGVRPTGSTDSRGGQAFAVDGVCVTGVVNLGEQFQAYEQTFRDAIGYYPKRDRPQYLFVEIERRQVQPGVELGPEEGWVEISSSLLPDSLYGGTAPEIVHPDYFDSQITRRIPPIINFDYRDLVLHERVKTREILPESMRPGGALEINEPQIFLPGAGSGSETRDNGSSVVGGGSKGEDGAIDFTDMSEYQNTSFFQKPKQPIKLVRFFDFATGGEASPQKGLSYQYRCRLWLNDPNDPDGFLAEGASFQRAKEMGAKMEADESGGIMSKGVEPDEDEDLSSYKLIKIRDTHLNPEVRSRLRNKAKSLEVPDFPAQPTSTVESAKDSLEESLANSWHTPWSEPTPVVTFGEDLTEFYASRVRVGKIDKLGPTKKNLVPRFEPSIDVLASVWLPNTKLRGNWYIPTPFSDIKTVKRAEILNFGPSDINILHPLDGSVRVVKEEDNKGLSSNAIVLDIMGGTLLEDEHFKSPIHMPGETIIMDSSGKMHIQNEFEDRKGLRHALFLADESSEYGVPPEGRIGGPGGSDSRGSDNRPDGSDTRGEGSDTRGRGFDDEDFN